MKPRGFLLIKKGMPYQSDIKIELTVEQTLIGRSYQEYHPDISFSDSHISRRHAIISCTQGIFTLTDLSSKHGTSLNNIDLIRGHSYTLHNGDLICLAKGMVSIKFLQPEVDEGITSELMTHDFESLKPIVSNPIFIDIKRRQVMLEENVLLLQGKELELLMALYINRQRAVCYDDIRKLVWPERAEGIIPGVPDVETSEITTLVYRLRQKLSKYSYLIVTIPRYGYRLDL